MALFLDQFTDEELISELHKRGYRVVSNEEFKKEYDFASSVRTIRELSDLFYARRRYYNRDRAFPLCPNFGRDGKFVGELVKSREKLGRDRPTAIAEAAALINALFKYEKFLNLREPITDPLILTNTSIMNRVCSYMNGEVGEVGEADTFEFLEEVSKEYDKKFRKQELTERNKEMEIILEKLNGNKKRK